MIARSDNQSATIQTSTTRKVTALVLLLAVSALRCSSPSDDDAAGYEGPGPSGNGANGSGTSGGCGIGTTYCAAHNICILDDCQNWCQVGQSYYCEESGSPAGCTGPVHHGCDSGSGGTGSGGTGSGGTGSGGTGSSTGGGQCSGDQAYCASCNVCLPPASCGAYWCLQGSLGGCSTSPSGLSGCTGPVHNGCDCGGSSTSPPPSGSGGSSAGSGQCHDLSGCVTGTFGSTDDCTQGIGYQVNNACGQPAYCRFCAVQNGAVNSNLCQAFTVNGSSIGQSFCGSGITSVKYACAPTTDDHACVRGF
jgi:hypothetical protein